MRIHFDDHESPGESRLLLVHRAINPAREVVFFSGLRASDPFHAQTAPGIPERKTRNAKRE